MLGQLGHVQFSSSVPLPIFLSPSLPALFFICTHTQNLRDRGPSEVACTSHGRPTPKGGVQMQLTDRISLTGHRKQLPPHFSQSQTSDSKTLPALSTPVCTLPAPQAISPTMGVTATSILGPQVTKATKMVRDAQSEDHQQLTRNKE